MDKKIFQMEERACGNLTELQADGLESVLAGLSAEFMWEGRQGWGWLEKK